MRLTKCQTGRLGLGLLLLALPACGLSDYETRMRDTQQREERFRNEKKYLDEPVQIPTVKDKDDKETQVANVFFRPPKGIQPKAEAEPRNNLLWRYPARSGEFAAVEMAFATEDKEFVNKIFQNYERAEEPKSPMREPPLPFDSWEFDGNRLSYSINVLKGGSTQVAVVYIFGKGRRDSLRPAIDLSLQSLAADQKVAAARQKYAEKSPWRLKPTPGR